MMELRSYQDECLTEIDQAGSGKWLIHMATGLGKTVVFSKIKRRGRVLILSHREELVRQPIKYFDCQCGIEQAGLRSAGEEVISASVQSMVRRLDRFKKDEFDTIITDECHHSRAGTYVKIYAHFTPRVHLGFTATPSRGDERGLDKVYDKIIFSRSLKWGIENGWLSPIECLRVNIGYDLRGIATRMGDFDSKQLEQSVNIESHNKAIAEAVKRYAVSPVLIFAVSIAHADKIAALIPGAKSVSGKSQDRSLADITVNCALFTEGVDIPNLRTVVIARPTQSKTLYTQMVGRGTRLYPGKEKLTLIDCVGSCRHNLCTAPTLIGLDDSQISERWKNELTGDLLSQLPDKIRHHSDTIESWINNAKYVDLWARENSYQLHKVAWFRMPDGSFYLGLPDKKWMKISTPDHLGNAVLSTRKIERSLSLQECFDQAYIMLREYMTEARPIWDSRSSWRKQPATEKQKNLIGYDKPLTKGEAAMILTRRFGR